MLQFHQRDAPPARQAHKARKIAILLVGMRIRPVFGLSGSLADATQVTSMGALPVENSGSSPQPTWISTDSIQASPALHCDGVCLHGRQSENQQGMLTSLHGTAVVHTFVLTMFACAHCPMFSPLPRPTPHCAPCRFSPCIPKSLMRHSLGQKQDDVAWVRAHFAARSCLLCTRLSLWATAHRVDLVVRISLPLVHLSNLWAKHR